MGVNEHGFLARFRETRDLVIIRELKLKGSGVKALKSATASRTKRRARGGVLAMKIGLNWVRLVVFMFLGRLRGRKADWLQGKDRKLEPGNIRKAGKGKRTQFQAPSAIKK
jgi:hypothetical protein